MAIWKFMIIATPINVVIGYSLKYFAAGEVNSFSVGIVVGCALINWLLWSDQ